MEDFETFLRSKKIDSSAFKKADETTYASWSATFCDMSVASFTMQKLYHINQVRRRFPLAKSPDKEVHASGAVEKKTVALPFKNAKPKTHNENE